MKKYPHSMTLIPVAVILLLSLVSAYPGVSQDSARGGLFRKARNLLHKAASWEPGEAVRTSIEDSLPTVRWLARLPFASAFATPVDSFHLRPGYYRASVRSYCLNAGRYSPSRGDGYQLAAFRGSRTELIESILNRSAQNPQVAQEDVQTLLWGIEAGVKFSDYSPQFRQHVNPLLSEKEILSLNVDVGALAIQFLPEKLKQLVMYYQSLRTVMIAAQSDYKAIENIAVHFGKTPPTPKDVVIDSGMWSYIGNGFYLRTFPRNYATTDIELYRPARPRITKDEKGRVTGLTEEGSEDSISIEYNDAKDANVFKSRSFPDIPIWRIKKITFSGKTTAHQHTIIGKGWLFRGNYADISALLKDMPVATPVNTSPVFRTSSGPFVSDIGSRIDDLPVDGLTIKDILETLKEWKAEFDELKEQYDGAKKDGEWLKKFQEAGDVRSPDEYLNETANQQQVIDGLKAASNISDFDDKAAWFWDLQKMDIDLMAWFHSVLSNGSGNAPADLSSNPEYPHISSYIAQPGNAQSQRLGLSEVKK